MFKAAAISAALVLALPLTAHADADNRIVGGQTATGNYPWQVSLLIGSGEGQGHCGGTVVHRNWVLTAAHCFDKADKSGVDTGLPVSLTFSRRDLTDTSTGFTLAGAGTQVHPEYVVATKEADIALIRLPQPVEIPPVKLMGPTFDATMLADGTPATGIGWGHTSQGGSSSNVLLEVQLPLVGNEACAAALAGNPITERMLCAGGQEGRDTCQGDSGGPLLVPQGNEWVEVGVVSFGVGCAQAGKPGVYARVSRFSQWLSGQMCSGDDLPAAVQPNIAVSGHDVSLSFAPVANATGYRLYFAPAATTSPIQFVDLGNSTGPVTATGLPSGSHFLVAVMPYNGNCLGPVPNAGIGHIRID